MTFKMRIEKSVNTCVCVRERETELNIILTLTLVTLLAKICFKNMLYIYIFYFKYTVFLKSSCLDRFALENAAAKCRSVT